MGLTSDRLTGTGAYFAGVASHYVPSARLEALEHRLAELDQSATWSVVNSAIEEFVADPEEMALGAKYELVGARRKAIDLIFKADTAERIVEGLGQLANGEEAILSAIFGAAKRNTAEVEGLKAWANSTKDTIELRSPTSVKLTLLAIREGKKLDIDEAFKMEMRIATACCVSRSPRTV